MASQRVLQPLWSYILNRWGNLVSFWTFPSFVGWVAYLAGGVYFALKDMGLCHSNRIHKDVVPPKTEILRVGGIQIGGYAIDNLLLWNLFPYRVSVPLEAPTVWELLRDVTVCFIVGDFLVYVEHIVHHKVPFLYRNVHYVHHRFKADLFAWCAGWVHLFELTVFASCMVVYPVVVSVHPLVMWIYLSIFVWLLLEEHSGQDVWWSPYRWVPDFFGGAVPHDVHHMKVSTNYGFVLAIWDHMFGTFIAPQPSKSKDSS